MIDLPDAPPDPLPEIHPVSEHAASGQLAEWYEDMKSVLQVPWMGVVTMAYAHYPTFFSTFWEGLRPICASRAYVDVGREIRETAEDAVATALDPPIIVDRLRASGYGDGEIAQIRELLEVFSHGNTTYYGLVTMTTLLIEGHEIGPEGEIGPPAKDHGPAPSRPLVLIEPHHADEPTRRLYDEIKATLGLPFVNTDYRALARWPTYFAEAWHDLGAAVGTKRHRQIAVTVHDVAVGQVSALPNPTGLTSADLCAAAESDASLEEVQRMCGLFHYLIPGLITNIAFLRHQLQA